MTVVVTGGASGIGWSLVRLLTSRGVPVVVVDRAPAPAPDWAGGVAGCEWVTLDVADAEALGTAIDAVAARRTISGLATCAGRTDRVPLLDLDPDDWEDLMRVNVLATAVAAQHVASAMIASGTAGAIVTVASTAGLGSVAGLGAAYHASKGAVVALTAAMAVEAAPHGIRVNAVAPGLVRTPMSAAQRAALGDDRLAARVPQGRLAEPEEVAAAIGFLLSPASAMVTGHVLPVEGGQLALAMPPEAFPVERTPVVAAAWGAAA